MTGVAPVGYQPNYNAYSASMNTPQQVLLGGGGQVIYHPPGANYPAQAPQYEQMQM